MPSLTFDIAHVRSWSRIKRPAIDISRLAAVASGGALALLGIVTMAVTLIDGVNPEYDSTDRTICILLRLAAVALGGRLMWMGLRGGGHR